MSSKCYRESTRKQRRRRPASADVLQRQQLPPPRLFRAAPVVGCDVAGPAGDQHDAAGAGKRPHVALGRGGLDAEDELGGGGAAGGRLGADFRAQGESRVKAQFHELGEMCTNQCCVDSDSQELESILFI